MISPHAGALKPPKYHLNFFPLKTCTIKSDQDGSYPFSIKVKILTAEFSKRKKKREQQQQQKAVFLCYVLLHICIYDFAVMESKYQGGEFSIIKIVLLFTLHLFTWGPAVNFYFIYLYLILESIFP